MSRPWWSHSLRLRLTLWYAAALAAILLLYATGAHLFVRGQLYAELDRQLYEDFEAAEAMLEIGPTGHIQRRLPREHASHEPPAERACEVWSLDGRRLYREGPEGFQLPSPAISPAPALEQSSLPAPAGGWLRVRAAPYPLGDGPVWLRVARSEGALRHQLDEFLFGMALGLPLAVVLACLGGYFLAGRALAPVGRMAAQARTITADRLGERLVVVNPRDELGQLGSVFNETLARLERSFEALRCFTADAAHELRTPLTAMKAVGEIGLQESHDLPAFREVVGSMLEDADRLAQLVDALLTLSRADSRKVIVQREPLELLPFAKDVASLLEVLAQEKGQSLRVEGDPGVVALADGKILRQALINILDNAIKHSPKDSTIRVAVAQSGAEASILVSDQGPGIASEHAQRIFERFYRVDRARSRETGGTGLGLAIADWAVSANQGRIELESVPGEGSRFRICLASAASTA